MYSESLLFKGTSKCNVCISLHWVSFEWCIPEFVFAKLMKIRKAMTAV